ncbi:rho-related GTP-binding protein RhoJ-like [Dreissena polymorpha]|uniref:rho-related GTP-binding protein RhoJ-like n=1 Tax=Dreissena polymorpha TaxID=45954 RepID=UPI002264DE45|nr:rho-related GTP-binding protein RhoJ-like [Dreissena polymorpha]
MFTGVLKVGKHDYRLDLLDTTEHPDIEDRRQRFPGTDVIIICFSVINPDSFKNVQTKWIPELRKALGVTPFIILGTHVDLRQDPDVLQQLQIKGQKPVSSRVASAACRRLGGKCYVESSSTMKTRMRQALDEALLSVFNPDLNRSTCCVQ